MKRKILSLIMALVMIATCLVSPAMATTATTQTPTSSYEAVSMVTNPETGETTYAEVTGTNPELDPNKEVTIMVALEGETTYMQTGDLQTAAAGMDTHMAALAQAESRIEASLSESIEIEDRYSLLFNGFSFTGESWMIDAINEMDGVVAFEDPIFELIEPEAAEETDLTPSMGNSTGMVGATNAWDLGYTGEGMIVAVIDTGIRQTHEAFSVMPENGKIDKAYLQQVYATYGDKLHAGTAADIDSIYYNEKLPFNWDYFDNNAVPNHTFSDHGTHVAGIAAGNNGASFKGVAPDAQIVTMQVFTDAGGAAFSTLMLALEDCVYLGVDAVNMSLGVAAHFTDYASIDSGMETIYDALAKAGISVCAAAGNDGHANQWVNPSIGGGPSFGGGWFTWNPDYGTISAPATLPGSFAVASAVNFISYGPAYMAYTSAWGTTADLKLKPEITAPGDGVNSSIGFGGDASYSTWNGTSMATPHVAGGMLLIKQRLREVFPNKTAAEINELAHSFIMNTADRVSGVVRQAGAGLMDLEGALTTDAYLTVPGVDRPKLELGESEDGEFTFTFEVNNFGNTSRTYVMEPSILTELASEMEYSGYRENEGYREYNQKTGFFLSNPTPTTVKLMRGDIKDVTDLCEVSGPKSVTVKAGETVQITMTIKAGEELLKYIEENFPTGIYLEGYINLKDSATEGVDLSIPFLGFVGDWDYAPMFDLGFWWNLPYGVNNMAQMPVTKGTYIGYGVLNQGLGLNPYVDETGKTYLADRNTISPNGDGWLETINYAEFSLMRIPKTMKVYLEDAEGNVIQTLHESTYSYRKEYYVEGLNGGTTYSYITWDYDASVLEENETVNLVLEAWLDHEGYDPANNMNGRMVFPFTKDTIAPEVTVIDGGIQIRDANYIAYYGVYADASRTKLLYETGVFAEERGVAEEYLTDLDTYFVRVADYGRNEAFYMVRDGKLYAMDTDGFDHSTKTIFSRQTVNRNEGYNEYNWVTYNPETPAQLNFLQEPSHEIPENASRGHDYKDGAVMPDGTVYIATNTQLYTLDIETQEVTYVTDFQLVEGATMSIVRAIMVRPGTDELYAFNFSDYTGAFNFYVSRLDPKTGKMTPVFLVQDSWTNTATFQTAWAACFVDSDTVCIHFNVDLFAMVNLHTGELEQLITLDWCAPKGEVQDLVNGTGGSLLYDEDKNCLYVSGNISMLGFNRYNAQGLLVYDLDTGETDIRYNGNGLGYDLQGLFFLEDTQPDECIYYLEEIAPTCDAEGYTLHTCVDCGKEYRDNFVPALGHTYEGVVTEPTCTTLGYTTYTCTVCGDSYIDEVVGLLPHSYETDTVEPTCEDYGYTVHTCTACGTSYVSGCTAPYCPAESFTDVDTDQWYHEGVCYVLRNGLMEGMGDGKFAPNSNLTRGQLVTILYRLEGEPSVEGLENPFEDVAADEWYTDAIIWAANEEIITGRSATIFAPTASITREEAATILYRYNGAEPVAEDYLQDFADGDKVNGYAKEAMNWAIATGLITGMEDGTLAPRGTATRAQIATILMRYCQ